MKDCVGCRTISCIVSYNSPKKISLCPCVSCIIKVTCLVPCKEYKEVFNLIFGVEMTTNHKCRHLYEEYAHHPGVKPTLVLHIYDLNKEETTTWNPTILFPGFK